MKKKIIVIIAVFLLFAAGLVALILARNNAPNTALDQWVNNASSGNPASTATGTGSDIQRITIGIKNFNYYPNTITVKKGIPVELTLDSSVSGCYRTFVISEFGVNTYSKDPSQAITFTPDKSGTFKFQCSMGMGVGTLIVV